MLESMTGFGRADNHSNGFSIDVEIRTVNNRYCDIFIKLPSEFQHFENEIRQVAQGKFDRGKINVTIKIDQNGNSGSRLSVNEQTLSSYLNIIDEIRNKAGIEEKPSLHDLLQFEDLFQSNALTDEAEKALLMSVKSAVSQACDKTIEMRKKEGEQLSHDLLQRIDDIENLSIEIQEIAAGRVDQAREKMRERISNLVGDESFDKERLELEIAILADKLDITEEVVRLQSHLKFFREAVSEDQAAGRKLNFLMQEILREINTIGSKANNSEISHKVVEAKERTEVIREQIQNIA